MTNPFDIEATHVSINGLFEQPKGEFFFRLMLKEKYKNNTQL